MEASSSWILPQLSEKTATKSKNLDPPHFTLKQSTDQTIIHLVQLKSYSGLQSSKLSIPQQAPTYKALGLNPHANPKNPDAERAQSRRKR